MPRPKQKKSGIRTQRPTPANAPPPSVPQQWFFFCDEAGNAGSNWLDAAQPHHVAAGWLVRASKRTAFEEVLHAAVKDTQATELKGATLLRRPRGVQVVIKVLRALGQHAIPFFIIAERRFCIAGKAVEVFLDPVTNPAARWLPTGAFHRRQGVWEIVSELPDEVLVRFANAYRAPTPAGFQSAAAAIANALQATNAPSLLAESFEVAAGHATAICKYETHDSADAAHNVVTALNAPVFFHLVKKADRLLGAAGDTMIVIHDEISRFDRVFERTIRTLTVPAGDSAEFHGPDGEMVRMGVQNVSRFEARSSAVEVGVQAADLLASSVAKLAREAREAGPWSDDLHELASLTLPALLDGEDPPLAGMMGHRDSLGQILLPLFRSQEGKVR